MSTTNKKQYLIGVSGGPDSIYLLDRYQDQIKVACHINYNKRPTALRDQLIVSDYCLKNKIPLEILSVSPSYQYHKNFQDQARKIRYDFFLSTGLKYQVDQCLIAHHKDDFLETAIMQYDKNQEQLFYGLHQDSSYRSLKIFRPLLNLWKDEILSYLEQDNIVYGVDESNFLSTYQRNKIRTNLSKLTQEQKQAQLDFFLELNKKNQVRYQSVKDFFSSWDCNYLDLINSLEYYNLLYLWFSKNNIKYSKQKAENILSFLQKKNNKRFRLKAGVYLIKEGIKLKIVKL
ncbi:tRNA(Ile)-lysidine synthase [Mycoplasmoides gallisepticum CA06_2006.052-5-2P]|uniref:tRNA(Ile)-lysidine synthase n=1 Tax=Mycoplasmoides gallisepticum WI01_2001.043-13-2P TaxID=1159201 RepID=J3YTK2_MYCGL|nr:tRNA lysidine(34) synthetase TilS [Mycoplasmoides gallisepticum]AFP76229.1 tRNA(Ile)-lysidine synthase [Mycoplasmoides gallisepticum VA94_7994-1-7P]AFP76996.1 tRNA(Ile)-lysidine synthase [Mycoplasmoides gallisepticum NC95_13295-2-2P]AFP77754.1 tRNA(Ile)-lysidine synthase [Mycoplasmoides gallisepticum NC96_1596-4-2P]AFP78521.1 tRNA(Ile)-lysidine synthase [Mycoplasmoides gallisepticum NY01_2001.047-5-1P]AFP79281.1 tRNA(Ile)-lysidine synthase [Mycoplasmoides gallisepticum WI01_2001.043-13-2P]